MVMLSLILGPIPAIEAEQNSGEESEEGFDFLVQAPLACTLKIK